MHFIYFHDAFIAVLQRFKV